MGRRAALIAFPVGFMAGPLKLWIPWVTTKREVISQTPSPPAVFTATSVPVHAGGRACLDDVSFDVDSQVVGFTLARFSPRQAPTLAVSASAPGYRARATARPDSTSVR